MPNDQPNMLDADSQNFESMFSGAVSADDNDTPPSGEEPIEQPDNKAQRQASDDDGNPAEGSPSDQVDDDGNGGQGDETPEPKDDPGRVNYWQSKADRAAAELEKVQKQMEASAPLMKYINENPQLASKVYSVVQDELGSSDGVPSQGAPQAKQPNMPPKPERPAKPERPENFSLHDAMSDPQSESAKYQTELTKYQEDLAAYNENLVDYREKVDQAKAQQQQKQTQEQQMIQEAYNEAVYRHGMKPQEAQTFVNWAKNAQYGLDDLVKLYRIKQGKEQANSASADALRDRNKRLDNPAPPVTSGNEGNPSDKPDDRTDDEKFADSFVGAIKEFTGEG